MAPSTTWSRPSRCESSSRHDPGARSPALRKATPADALAIATINVRAWQDAYRGLLPDSYLDGLSVPDRTPAGATASPSCPTVSARGWPRPMAKRSPIASAVPIEIARTERGPIATRSGEIYAIYCPARVLGNGRWMGSVLRGRRGPKGPGLPVRYVVDARRERARHAILRARWMASRRRPED